jgi:hypothetical protein
MLLHIVANTIPLGLQITRQEVPQLLIHLGNCLVVQLLGFLEHLLGLLELQPRASMSLSNKTVTFDPAASRRFFSVLDYFTTAFPSFPHWASSPFCLMMLAMTCALSAPMEVDGHVETGIIWKLDLQNLRYFLGGYEICHRDLRDGWLIA